MRTFLQTGWYGFLLLAVVFCGAGEGLSQEISVIPEVERQPLMASIRRLTEALAFAGAPLEPEVVAALDAAMAMPDDRSAVTAVQQVLDPLCLAMININPESRVKVTEGPVRRELMQQGWRAFLVKVHNEAGINPPLQLESPNALPMYQQGRGAREEPRTKEKLVNPDEIPDRFLDLSVLQREPLKPNLSGLAVEYRVVLLFSRDAGQREALLSFHIGAGTQDLGFRSALPVLFKCLPATRVVLRVHDTDGQPTTASFVIRDQLNRVYPLPSRRLAPDFFFHDQIYRADGESVSLPPGEYSFVVNRGPEYVPQRLAVTVPDRKSVV